VDVYTVGDGSRGVNVYTVGDGNKGVDVATSGDNSDGVWAVTLGANSPSVAALTQSAGSFAVKGETVAGSTSAIYGKSYGANSPALYGYTTNTGSVGLHAQSAQSNAIWADTERADNKYGLQTPDIIRALNYETGSSDVAEYMPVTMDFAPGTVLVIGDDGKLEVTSIAYDTRVAGIVSKEPGVSLGAKEEGNNGEELIAVAGRVPCKVDAKYGAIHPGDLLSTSDTPGHAMKAEPMEINGRTFYPSGIVLGKAMGTLESGTGTIEVLVTLQ
jgi:hypothetical protein